MAEEKQHPIKYMSFGSPLLDLIADVSQDFIIRNNIKLDTTEHRKLGDIPFINEFLTQCEISYVPGGCQFNAMRVFNWMLDKDETDIIGFLGSVGDNDDYGDKYQDDLLTEGIIPVFQTIDNETTGMCIVLCCDRDRSHFTDLGASVSISDDFVERCLKTRFNNVKLIYTELFMIRCKKDVCYKVAELGLRDETIYGFNLPSDFFLNKYKEDISKLCEYADIIFANKAEATYFAKALKLKINKDEDIEDIALNLCKNIPKINVNKKRIVVVTCGQNPAACCEYDHKEKKVTFLGTFEVRDVPQENIIDTNGAGDSFAGGFLSQLVKGKKLDECMKAGHWAASIIIQKRGCNIPMDIKFNSNSI